MSVTFSNHERSGALAQSNQYADSRKSNRSINFETSIDNYYSQRVNNINQTEDSSLLKSICIPINETEILKEYDVEEKDWENLIGELQSELDQENIKCHITNKYGNNQRNALMSILVCDPPLEVVKLIVELGGNHTVTDVSECGYNTIHYACWGNASLEVIQYLLGIGEKKALLQKSKAAGANPLHVTCTRYNSTDSNSLCDVIQLLIKVGKHDVVTATDLNNEIPLQGLLLRPEMPTKSVITFFDAWYELDNTKQHNEEFVTAMQHNEEFVPAFNKVTQQLLRTDYDARSQILKTDYMKAYLTDKFIQPLPLAILMTDLYIQVLIVCVFSFFINNTSPNLVDSITIVLILGICVSWRLVRELNQLSTSSVGVYYSDVSNWLDILQIILIIWTMCINLDDHSSSSTRTILTIATFYAWIELLFELHNFCYTLAVFVVATTKIMQRLGNFLFSTLIFVAAFAHMYYISVTPDEDFCNNLENITEAQFFSEGGFTCTRKASYIYSLTNIFTFETPSGVPQVLPLVYAFVMLVLLLNVVIAVICSAFEEVANESEMSFWSHRLTIVNELKCSYGHIHQSTLPMFCNLMRHNIHPMADGHKVSERIDLSLFLEKSEWDRERVKENEKCFIQWWYGKADKEKAPTWRVRLQLFFTLSKFKDILTPGNVFENIILGKNRSHSPAKHEKMLILPLSIMLLVVSNAVVLAIFFSGCVTFGLLWPMTMRSRLFAVNIEKRRITSEIVKKNGEISVIKEEVSVMKKENSEMKTEIQDMRKENNEMNKEIQDMRKENNEMMNKILSVIEKSRGSGIGSDQ